MASIDCVIDTTPMAKEIATVSNHVNATTTAVVAMKTAVIAAGRSISETDLRPYEKAGGTLLMGDSVTEGMFSSPTDGLLRLDAVKTANFGDYPLFADTFVIATGKFLGKGIIADMDKVYEPVFGLDVDFDPDRSNWFDPDFAAAQRFLEFGVRVDALGRPSIGGKTVGNLFACGELLAGVSSVSGREASARSADTVISSILSTPNE